jgi:uncharacterized protein with HEPN domain
MQDELIPLHDILREIAVLQSIRTRSTLEAFKASAVDTRAASYSILVISEAVRRVPDDWLRDYEDIPWHAVRTIGNKLRHEYQRVSPIILWDVMDVHADALRRAIEDMIVKRSS